MTILRRAAENLGVTVKGRNKEYHSNYDATKYDAKMVFNYQQGTAAVINNDKGGYELMIDNFCNPITEKLGKDCSILGREYSKLMVEKQAIGMGGIVTASTLNSNGEVLMQISL